MVLQPQAPGVPNGQGLHHTQEPKRASQSEKRAPEQSFPDSNAPGCPSTTDIRATLSRHPCTWNGRKKWIITLVVCFVSLLTGLPAGAYKAENDQMADCFHIHQEGFPTLYWATTSWFVGAATIPLVFVPVSESFGRLSIYLGSYVSFVVSLFAMAFVNNFATAISSRFFAGGASSVCTYVAAGIITDIWRGARARSKPLGILSLASIAGMVLGPPIASVIQHQLDWRWVWYIQITLNGLMVPGLFFTMAETRGEVIVSRISNEAYALPDPRRRDLRHLLKCILGSLYRPINLLITEGIASCFSLWVTLAWGTFFLFQSSIPYFYKLGHNFSAFHSGLVQIAIFIGVVLAALVNPLQDRLYLQSARRNQQIRGTPIPEARLYFSTLDSAIFTGALFWYATDRYIPVRWILPTMGLAFAGFGIYGINTAAMNYLADWYKEYASSALCAAYFGVNILAAFMPLASIKLYGGFTNDLWAPSLPGIGGVIVTCMAFVLFIQGANIRRWSSFMSHPHGHSQNLSDNIRNGLTEIIPQLDGSDESDVLSFNLPRPMRDPRSFENRRAIPEANDFYELPYREITPEVREVMQKRSRSIAVAFAEALKDIVTDHNDGS